MKPLPALHSRRNRLRAIIGNKNKRNKIYRTSQNPIPARVSANKKPETNAVSGLVAPTGIEPVSKV
jgi:hypothetical protein